MRSTFPILAACTLALAGCEAAPDDQEEAPTPDPCAGAPGLLSVSPESDADDQYISSVSATWDAVPEDASLVLADDTGAAVTGTLTVEDSGRTLLLDFGAPLAPSTTYTATVGDACSDDASWSFSTGPFGDELDDEEALVGRVFSIDLGSADIVQPAGIGGLLSGLLTDEAILFELLDTSDFATGVLHVRGALGTQTTGGAEQDLCSETLPLTYGQDGELGTEDDVPASWTDPYLRVGPTDLTLEVEGTEATISDLFLEMLFHPNGESFVGGRLEGSIDTRPLVGLVDSTDPNAICALAEKTVGIACEPCPDGEDYCLTLEAVNIEGEREWDGGLIPRTQAEIDEDPVCQQ